jgi:hypothetical protein
MVLLEIGSHSLPTLIWSAILIFYASPTLLGWQMCATMPSFFPLRWRCNNFFFSGAGLDLSSFQSHLHKYLGLQAWHISAWKWKIVYHEYS